MDTKNQKHKNCFEHDNLFFIKSLPNSNTSVIEWVKAEITKSGNFEGKNWNKIFGFQHNVMKFHT